MDDQKIEAEFEALRSSQASIHMELLRLNFAVQQLRSLVNDLRERDGMDQIVWTDLTTEEQ